MSQRRPPPLQPPPDPDLARDTTRSPALVLDDGPWDEDPGKEWDGPPDSRLTIRVPRKAFREGHPARRPSAAQDSIPVHEVPETLPPPSAPPPEPSRTALVAPLRRAAIERAALRLAWTMVGCTVVLAAAILAAAWGR